MDTMFGTMQPAIQQIWGLPPGVMHLNRVTNPLVEPLTVAQVKNHLRVDADFSNDDGYIQTLITVAREYCEDYVRRSFGICQWELVLDEFPPDKNYIEFPIYPLVSIDGFTFYDAAGNLNTIDLTSYIIDTSRMPGAMYLPYFQVWPLLIPQPGHAAHIQFHAGHDTTLDTDGSLSDTYNLPQRLIWAMYLLIGHLYNNREVFTGGRISELPFSINNLLDPLKVWMGN